jgi:hypothetical protein
MSALQRLRFAILGSRDFFRNLERDAQIHWPSSFVTRLAIFTPLSPLTYFAMPR